MIHRLVRGTALLSLLATPAFAREPSAFAGPHVGAAVTAVNHHFVLEETAGNVTTSRNVTDWGPGGMVFAGYDIDIGRNLIAGVEGAFLFGGKSISTVAGNGSRYGATPRYGFSAAARLGLVATPDLMLFAKAGYGEHRYRETVPAGQEGSIEATQSVILGGGAEYRLGKATALRAEFEHLDGSRNQFALGVAFRF